MDLRPTRCDLHFCNFEGRGLQLPKISLSISYEALFSSFSFIFNAILVLPYPIIKELEIYTCDFSITRKYNCICEKHL